LKTRAQTYTVKLLKRKWLSKKTFEIFLSMSPAFAFKPGQRIRLSLEGQERDYSIVSAPEESELTLCIRMVAGGKLSVLLSVVDTGTSLIVNGPHGYFTYKPSPRPAVFVATGVGIAPFCSMARSGISGFTLLHGVGLPDDLYYASLFRQSARKYIPCLTGPTTTRTAGGLDFTARGGKRQGREVSPSLRVEPDAKHPVRETQTKKLPANTFRGKVTGYLEQHLTPEAYDFYLCGRSEMIRDVTLLVDERFPGSLVYTESFY
jgi:benzoate/toluate 1,2-dioxygenase reductase subunit